MKPTVEEIIEAVEDMRHWQREYFRTRQSPAVTKAKAAERRVDKLLEAWRQPGLFDKDGGS